MASLHPSILFVDPDSALRESVPAALREAGYTVEVAADGARALLLLATLEPNLVIADMILPEISGIQLLYSIKETLRLPTRVMLTSSLQSSVYREYALALGADWFLDKPYAIPTLLSHCRKLLRPSSDTPLPQRIEDILSLPMAAMPRSGKSVSVAN